MVLPTDFQKFVHLSRYSRYLDDKGRRETWEETVTRYCDFWRGRFPDLFPYERARAAILGLEVMPSMRALMTAGPALQRDEMAGFNCSYITMDHVRAFDEALYVLMCGTGLGFSVEAKVVGRLPLVAEDFYDTGTTIVVADSKMGWASAYREIISLLYAGRVPKWDVSKVRPPGARLKTFGGRASGPQPLVDLFEFTIKAFKAAAGRRLAPLEVHDIVCKIADVVVVGGVRRSALISLSDLSDTAIQGAKSGIWWDEPEKGIYRNGQRSLANNSAVYEGRPDTETFLAEWQALIKSKSGERGIFNRQGATNAARATNRRELSFDFGTNPCGEIVLRPAGLCNLTEVIVRAADTLETLREKVELATILGTFQSTLTKFRYVRKIWRDNAEEERLLGVSMTGIMDSPLLNKVSDALPTLLGRLRQHAIETNATWANELGIPASAAITTVKPSGTVSQLTNTSSGIHPRWSPFYSRAIRADKKDPLAKFMRAHGFSVEDCVSRPAAVDVFSFPQSSPQGAICVTDVSAIEQLRHYLVFKQYWCEHNPSITVYVKDDEWLEVGAWVHKHFDDIGGIAFLPHQDNIYKQAPYQEISEEQYLAALRLMPVVDWNDLNELDDQTIGAQTLSCSAGVCEL